MAKQTITHVGPAGHSNDEQKAQNDFARALIEAAEKRQAEIDAEKAKGGKK